jgi:hypothetical protein
MANQQNNDFQDALMTHDHLKRSTNLPLFYADESNEIATSFATWDDKRKGQELVSIL